MRPHLFPLLAAALTGCLAASPEAAPASPAAGGPVSLEVRSFGVDPAALPARAGRWLPLDATIRNDGAAVSGALRVRRIEARGPAPVAYERRVSLAAGALRVEPLFFFLREEAGRAEVALVPDGAGEPLARAEFAWSTRPEALLVLVSDDGSALRFAAGTGPDGLLPPPARAVALAPAGLPASAEGLDLATAVIVANADLRSITPAQGEALRGYVEGGGRLLLVFSGSAGAYRGTALDPILPCEVAGAEPRPVRVLEAFGARGGGEPLLVAAVRPAAGAAVSLVEDGRPLAVRRRVGAGSVTFLAFDPSGRPTGGAAGALASWLLSRPGPLCGEGASPAGATGDPILARLAARAASVEGIRPPSFAVIGALLLAYAVLAVPASYLFWRRRGRFERTAPSAAVLALVFGGAIYGLGVSRRGRLGLETEAALMSGAAGDAAGGATGACGLFAPERRLARIDARLAAAPAPAAAAGGAADPGLGAAVVRADGPGGPGRAIDNVELDQWSLRLFAVSGPSSVPVIEASLTLGARGWCQGRIVAPEGRGLRDARLVIGDRALALGDFRPGETREVAGTLGLDAGAAGSDPDILRAAAACRLAPVAADRELEALLVARVDPESAPLLAVDFETRRLLANEAIAIAIPLRLERGPVSLPPGVVRPRLVAARPDVVRPVPALPIPIAGRVEAPRFALGKGEVALEWTLPAREGFRPELADIDLALSLASPRLRLFLEGPGGRVEAAAPRTGALRLARELGRGFDPRTGVFRVVLENGGDEDVIFGEPTLAVQGTFE